MKYHALIFGINNTTMSSLANSIVMRSPGAHRIATFLREQDWDVEVIDFAGHWSNEQLQALVKSRTTKNTVFFGFSTMFSQWVDTLNDFTSWLKQTYPHIATIAGGNSVGVVNAKHIDYWIDGYGEQAILAVAKHLTNHSSDPLKFDPAHFGSKKLIKAVHSYPSYPLPNYSSRFEPRDFVQPYEWSTFEFSRGCRFNCSFCNFPVLGVKDDYTATSESVAYDLQYNYDHYGVKNYYVVDETFNDSVDKIKKYADVVESLSFRPFFSGYQRVDLMISHKQSLEHLARMNFGGHHYGIESFNPKSVKAIGKGMHPDKIKQGLLDIKDYFLKSNIDFYRGNLSFIVGLPHETKEYVKESRDWVVKNWLDQSAGAFALHLYDPQSAMYHTNTSEFTRNLSKYNFREMQGDVQLPHFRYEQGQPHKNEFGMVWEHDSMNLVQAMNLVDDWRNHVIPTSTLDNWKLHLPFFIKQDANLSWDQIATLKKRDWQNIDLDIVSQFVNDYINKKLSL